MRKLFYSTIILLTILSSGHAQLKPGDVAPGFSLPEVKGEMVSLNDYPDSKGIVLIFTCNTCPFAQAYEARIKKLHKNFAQYGYPVILINPNDEKVSPDDSMIKMRNRAKENDYQFAYLKDAHQKVAVAYGAKRTPEAFVLKNANGQFRVIYIGAIDDNAIDAGLVGQKYIENALSAIETGETPEPQMVRSIGCTIKVSE